MLSRAGAPLPSPAELFAGLERARGLVLAVSGGPDSFALLALVDGWRRDAPIRVSVATVDHRLRPDSGAEAAAVAAACARRGLPHATLTWEGPKPAAGLPAAARAARYALLAAQARETAADTIVTAHHADDQAETVLMRLLRGSGPAGLAGMSRLSPLPGDPALRLARPLLACAKADLLAFCRAQGLAYFEDPTNADETYRRPQMRRLAALLAREGLGRDELLRLAARAARAESALARLIGDRLAALPATRSEAAFEAPADAIAGLPEEALVRLILGEIGRIAPGGAARLEQAERVARRLRAGPPATATLAGVVIRLDAKRLIMKPQPPRRG